MSCRIKTCSAAEAPRSERAIRTVNNYVSRHCPRTSDPVKVLLEYISISNPPQFVHRATPSIWTLNWGFFLHPLILLSMPGGRKNPLSVTNFVEKVADAVHTAKANAHDLAQITKDKVEEKLNAPCVDLTIQFIGASGLPKMDVVGAADPYFVAKIDSHVSMVTHLHQASLSFCSIPIPNSLASFLVWNEIWRVKNVPITSDIYVEVLDKDVGAPIDDFIGKFKTSVAAGAKELEIEGPLFRRDRGTFWLKVDSTPSADPAEPRYLFDGPIRYSRHFSPTIGRLTNLDDTRLYSTWKIYLVGVSLYFKDVYQYWNHDYKAAQSIFGTGPTSLAIRTGIQAGHRLLYSRSTSNGFGIIASSVDVLKILHSDRPNPKGIVGTDEEYLERRSEVGASTSSTSIQNPYAHRVKPAVYTYIISAEDDSLRFSETGAAFFVDFASKHALHTNCSERVRYSGEFHPRPRAKDASWVGWDSFDDTIQDGSCDWEILIDNNSGTYSPDKAVLPTLQALLEYNFPGFGVKALDREDEELKKSVEACRKYALNYRGVQANHLQPHLEEGEESLMQHAGSVKAGVAVQ
ncbi:hypothetical protein D9757_001188 [Collybiopsis confluens]|uniref:C2 domain-containing protein n=1 Tax=Collybiopsis confluens TaxID=2823264 RepID=A0A8H5I126_9AGAR|nr:hypothetical protein D9757_001188 [Collybiopsis confluens]